MIITAFIISILICSFIAYNIGGYTGYSKAVADLKKMLDKSYSDVNLHFKDKNPGVIGTPGIELKNQRN